MQLENYLTKDNHFLLEMWPTQLKTGLEVLEVNDAVILPWKEAVGKESWGVGGIVDSSGTFIDESKYVNGWSNYGGGIKCPRFYLSRRIPLFGWGVL